MKKVIIIGGGLSGLVSAISLRNQGLEVKLIEKKAYPFHRVCGEYVSNEVRSFLEELDIFPHQFQPQLINSLQLTAIDGKSAHLPLDIGGFGISRYNFDFFLFEKAAALGVEFLQKTQALGVKFENNGFVVEIEGQEVLKADVVIGAFGKRSKLDQTLKRSFLERKSPYIGVKYHIKYAHHDHATIALHNFKDGYCGINKIEDDKYNLCYLSSRSNMKAGIAELERNVLCKNPHLKKIFETAEFLFDKPEVINEISFETKKPVEEHILMVGDAAGMITPLCGNGMAMAIHSAKIVAEEVMNYCCNNYSRAELENRYTKRWNTLFSNRLWAGRQIQKLFGSELVSNFAVNVVKNSKPIARYLVRQTHGQPF